MTDTSKLDHILGAMADPTRRVILLRLSRGGARVTDLAAPFAISLNSVSKHIRILERAHLVERRRMGREHVLSRNLPALNAAAAWIETLQAKWHSRIDRLGKALDEEEA
jgi:DNA-binding transcriptional ArsR family regulator